LINRVLIILSLFLMGCNRNENPDVILTTIDNCLDFAKDEKNSRGARLHYNNQAFNLLCDRKNDSITRNKLFKTIIIFDALNELENVKKVLRVVYSKAVECKDSLHTARAYKCFGYYYMSKNNNDSSYYYFLKAKKIYWAKQDIKNLAVCYYNLSSIQYEILDSWNSEMSAIEALKFSRKAKLKDFEYCSLIMMGIISYDLQDYEKALERDFTALKLVEKYDLKQYCRKENCFNNIGGVYQNMNKHESALFFFNKALENKTLNYETPGLLATLLDNKAYSNFKLNNLKEAGHLFNESLKIRTKLNLKSKMAISYIHLSEYNAKIGDTILANLLAKKAITIATLSQQPQYLIAAFQNAIKIDKNSTQYFKIYSKLSDSLQLAERKNRNKFARIAFETEELTEEKDQAIQQKWIILGIAIIVLLFSILLFVIKMQRAKQKEMLFIQEQQKSDESIYQLIHDQQIKIGEGRQSEKKRISIELHDGVMNRLASTRLNLFILNKKRDDETIQKCLTFIDDIQGIEKEIRQVAHDLSNDLFSGNLSFNLLLETLFSEHKSISKAEIQTHIDHTINWEIIDNVLKMNLYRIIQETLQNCYKYAHARHIFVTISKELDVLYLSIHDDGNGFDLKKAKKGIGLKNITQRVKFLNGKLNIHSKLGEGTMINITLPIKK
jgi:signal transduction histidine kinase